MSDQWCSLGTVKVEVQVTTQNIQLQMIKCVKHGLIELLTASHLIFTSKRYSLHNYYVFFTEFTQSFGLLIHWPEDPQDKLLIFRLPGEEINRKELTEQIARLMADSKSSANTVSETQW